MVLSAFLAPLMPGIREAAQSGLRERATDARAVALAAVVRATDAESLPAVATGQREDNELVHPSRTAENWTATSETTTVSAVLVHPTLYIEGSGGDLGPHSFHPTVTIIGTSLWQRHFLNSGVVLSSMMPP